MYTERFKVVYEEGPHNWSAYVEGLPGACIATGTTREECQRVMEEAIRFHLEGLSPQERVELEHRDPSAVSHP